MIIFIQIIFYIIELFLFLLLGPIIHWLLMTFICFLRGKTWFPIGLFIRENYWNIWRNIRHSPIVINRIAMIISFLVFLILFANGSFFSHQHSDFFIYLADPLLLGFLLIAANILIGAKGYPFSIEKTILILCFIEAFIGLFDADIYHSSVFSLMTSNSVMSCLALSLSMSDIFPWAVRTTLPRENNYNSYKNRDIISGYVQLSWCLFLGNIIFSRVFLWHGWMLIPYEILCIFVGGIIFLMSRILGGDHRPFVMFIFLVLSIFFLFLGKLLG